MAISIIEPITWSETDKGVNVSGGGSLTMTSSNGYTNGNIRGNKGISSGKYYCEFKVNSNNGSNVGVGFASRDVPLTSYTMGNPNVRLIDTNGVTYPNFPNFPSVAYVVGEYIGMAIDMDNGTLSVYKNGILKGIMSTNMKALGTAYPYTTSNNSITSYSVSVNFGATAFAYAVPTGYLPYNESSKIQISTGTVQTTIESMQIGDYIPCRYTSLTYGQVGIFSELGTTTAPLIPPTSSATPDGSFYWIYVGKDYLGRKKFIADRNIQHSISWDSLNSAGIASEVMIDLGLGESYKSSIRLLTGGISLHSDGDDYSNEWDQIIVNSTLNNTITAGDNNIWNWKSVYSWTSSKKINNNNIITGRTLRGGISLNHDTHAQPHINNTLYGFRPVLLIEESAIAIPVINNPIKTILDNGLRISVSTDNITHQSNFPVKVKIYITKPDKSIAIKRDYDTDFQATPFIIDNTNFGLDEFDIGTSSITIEVIDNNGQTNKWTTEVIKSNKNKLLILDGNKLKDSNSKLLEENYSSIEDSNLEQLFLTKGSNDNIKFNNNFKSQVEHPDALKLLVLNIDLLE